MKAGAEGGFGAGMGMRGVHVRVFWNDDRRAFKCICEDGIFGIGRIYLYCGKCTARLNRWLSQYRFQ